MACFTGYMRGGLGLHREPRVVQISVRNRRAHPRRLRLGPLFREFAPVRARPRWYGSSSAFFAMVGALVFLGCPWRAYLRSPEAIGRPSQVSQGFPPASASAIGFLWRGFSLGKNSKKLLAAGYLMPLAAVALLVLPRDGSALWSGCARKPVGPSFFRKKKDRLGHNMPARPSLAVGLAVGVAGPSESRFCTWGHCEISSCSGTGILSSGVLAFVLARLSRPPCPRSVQTRLR